MIESLRCAQKSMEPSGEPHIAWTGSRGLRDSLRTPVAVAYMHTVPSSQAAASLLPKVVMQAKRPELGLMVCMTVPQLLGNP